MSSTIKAQRASSEISPRWSDLTDEQLLLAYRTGGATEAFETLVHRYERELYSYLLRYLGEATMAEDAFQATFLQVHSKREQFEANRTFRPWLYTIATNQAIDAQRRNKRHRILSLDRRNTSSEEDDAGSLVELLVGREPEACAVVEREERREWVRAAIGKLPDQLRGAVVLVYYQGIKYREAAEVLKIPVGTVKSRLNAALHRLGEAWNQTHPSEP